MELESRALSTPRNGEQKRKMPQQDSDDITNVSTSSSNDHVGRKRQSTSVTVTPQKKRRRQKMGEMTVAVYNLPMNSDEKRVGGNLKRFIFEIRNVEVEVVRCKLLPHLSGKATALVTFRDSDEARFALCLNGVKYAKRTLYARIYDPDFKSKETQGLIKNKQDLCVLHILGACSRGNSCVYAHDLAGLRLYNETPIDKCRCVYVNGLPKFLKSAQLVTAVVDCYRKNNVDAYVTYFQHRKSKRDAFFEFANPSHARMAPEVLDGLWSIGVHDWKPEYQAVFVAHFGRDVSEDVKSEHLSVSDESSSDEDDRSPHEIDNERDSAHQSSTNNFVPHSAGDKKARKTVSKQSTAQNVNQPPTPDQVERTSSIGNKVQQDQTVIELKETIISLREELLQAKTDAVLSKEKANDLNWKNKELSQDHTYNLQKMETLEKDNGDLHKRLDEAKEDIRYYKDKCEGDHTNGKEYRSMEEKVRRLQLENDSLRRQDAGSRHEQEKLKRRSEELETRLGGATERIDTYLKDMKELRERVRRLENTNHELQRQVSRPTLNDSSMEEKLRDAMSRNERLENTLKEATAKIDEGDNTNYHLRKEKEALTVELAELRATRNQQCQAAQEIRSSRWGGKVKIEPTG